MGLFSKKRPTDEAEKEETLILYKVVLALHHEIVPQYDQEGNLTPWDKKDLLKKLESSIDWINQLHVKYVRVRNEMINQLETDNKQLRDELQKVTTQKEYLENELLAKVKR